MEELRIGSPAGLLLSDVERASGVARSVRVRLVREGLTAEHTVVSDHYSDGFDRLLDFFTGLAEDWRGWRGPREHVSLENDLRLWASHTGSQVVIDVVVDRALDDVRRDWTVRASIAVDPGEQMATIAKDARTLLS